ncbi:hypothetical protein [Undibacterium sp.]|uniref:hypothetical protein n=1 Tax=Undibacterium sp. TaxID=1914977 RepID=UPI00374D1E7E
MNSHTTLTQLKTSLDAQSHQDMPAMEFCRLWRSHAALLEALPPRYAQVQQDLLSRLEASSLFTEESCSFSQGDLVAQLNMWLDKATQQLAHT